MSIILNNPHTMNENAAPFLTGSIAGAWGGHALLSVMPDLSTSMTPSQIVMFYVAKLAVTLILGFFGGMVGMLGKDVYLRIKKHFNKPKH